MLLDTIRSLFGGPAAPEAPSPVNDGVRTADPRHIAACVLLLDLAWADGELSAREQEHLERSLEQRFGLPPDSGHRLVAEADAERRRAVDHFAFTRMLREGYAHEERVEFASVMWELVLADGHVAEHEHYLTRKIANLLDLAPVDLSEAKVHATQRVERAGRAGRAGAG